MIGQRLLQARKAAGLSLRELAQRTGVSHTAINKYEKDLLTPSSSQLIAFAKTLGVRGEFFFRPMQSEIKNVDYRKKASMPKRLLDRVHGDVLDQAERWQELLSLYPTPPIESFSVSDELMGEIQDERQLEELAEELRHAWSLGMNAIPDLIDVLESKGIRVITTDADDQGKFDGLAGKVDGAPLIVVGRQWPGDRQRFTLAHELGHLMLGDRIASTLIEEIAAQQKRGDPVERLCNRFAGAFLLPRQTVIEHLGTRRQRLELTELLLLKQEYGLSMAACLFRALHADVISAQTHQELLALFGRQGWRKQEPGEPYPSEETFLFKQIVFRALGEEWIGESKAAELLGIPLGRFHQERKLGVSGAVAH